MVRALLAKSVNVILIAVLCLNALALSTVMASLVAGCFPKLMHQSPLMFQDFVKYYACGRMALSNERLHAYDRDFQIQTLKSILTPYIGDKLPDQYNYPIDYPPPVFAIMTPAAALPLNVSLFLFLVASIASTASSAFLIKQKRWKEAVLWTLALAASALSWRTFAMGQMTWMVMGLIGLYFYFLFKKRDVAAGLCLVLAAMKLQYAMFLLVPALVGRRFKLLLAMAVPIVLLIAITIAMMGTSVFAVYPEVVRHIEADDPYIGSMTCIRAVASLIVPVSALPVVTAVSLIAGLAACAFIWMRAWKGSDELKSWAVALTICIALITSPHTHSYDSLLVSVAALFTLPTCDPFQLVRTGNSSMRIWSWALLVYIPLSWILFKLPEGSLSVQVLGFMLFYFVLLVAAAVQFNAAHSTARSDEPSAADDSAA